MNRITKRQFILVLLGMMFCLLGITTKARAGGLLMINGTYRQPISSHIDVAIKDKIATTVLEQKFHNNLSTDLTATYIAPVPDGATVTSFAELVDGKWVDANIKANAQAQSDFATAAANGQDAAIMSAASTVPQTQAQTPAGQNFQIQVFLPPNGDRTVRLTYSQILNGEVGLTRYTYPLSASNLTDEKIGDLLVNVKIADNSEIRAVYSPSYKDAVEVSRPDKNSAELTYRAQNVTPAQDFDVIYTESSDKFGLNLASYRETDTDDGFFVLVAAPQLQAQQDDVIQKDFVFVLDCSGSMNGHKATQAKAALNRMLDTLNPGDRFTVLAFSSDVNMFSPALTSLDQRDAAHGWVNNYPVGGGTNINDALLKAMSTADNSQPNRPHIIVFLTDGQATDGTTDTQAILQNVHQANHGSSIYTIGVGDVNQALLGSLAQENRGTPLFVTDSQDLTKPLQDLDKAINNPVLVDLALNYGDVDVYDVYPNPIPDMFLGGQVVVTGRYHKGGATNVTLTGSINGQNYTSSYKDIKFLDSAADSTSYSFVARLWAQRKADDLMHKIDIMGPDPTIVEQIRQLGLKYSIITPYTSFVAVPNTGLPFLYTDDFRTTNTTLMIIGAVLIALGLGAFALKMISAIYLKARHG